MFEFPAFLPPTNLGLPMHSLSALTEYVSLNLARFFLLDPVVLGQGLHRECGATEEFGCIFPQAVIEDPIVGRS